MRTALFALTTLLLLPAPVTADWLQYGGDAARTGAAEDEGPDWPDVACQLTMPTVEPAAVGAPIILDGTAYVLIPDSFVHPDAMGIGPEDSSRLYRIDIEAAKMTEVARVDWPMYHLGSDGTYLVATGTGRVMVWGIDGSHVASRTIGELPIHAGSQAAATWQGQLCGAPAIEAGIVYVACLDDSGERPAPFVSALRVQDLSVLWARAARDAEANAVQDNVDACTDANNLSRCGWTFGLLPYGETALAYRPPALSVVGRSVLVATGGQYVQSASPGQDEVGYSHWAVHVFDKQTGEPHMLERSVEVTAPEYPYTTGRFAVPAPTGSSDATFTKNYYLRRYDSDAPRLSTPRSDVLFRDSYEGDFGSGFALANDRIYVTSLRGLFAFDLALESLVDFNAVGLPPSEAWAAGPLTLAGDMLLANAVGVDPFGDPSHSIIYAFNARTGDLRWRHSLDGLATLAVSDGVVVTLTRTGIVQVLGWTPAALQASVEASTQYPALGAKTVVDLSATAPGVHGPAAEYRADWGDGTITPWQAEPSFQHRYAEGVDRHARFFARNDAGQTASVPKTFHVGQDDPAVNILNSPFSPRYQETSFFLLGLILTFLVALIGVYRAGRKRRTLRQELRELEADVKQLRGTDRIEPMLAERRARARSLFLERRLEEAHASFLEKRIDEVQRSLRVGAVDEQLRFLSHGLVLRLKRLLADARVDAIERADFLDALERESIPTREKAKVLGLVESWFLRDEEARG